MRRINSKNDFDINNLSHRLFMRIASLIEYRRYMFKITNSSDMRIICTLRNFKKSDRVIVVNE